MSKKSINHHYNIEYVHPHASNSQSNKGKIILLLLLFLVLGVGFLFKNGNFSNYLQALALTRNNDIRASFNTNNERSITTAQPSEEAPRQQKTLSAKKVTAKQANDIASKQTKQTPPVIKKAPQIVEKNDELSNPVIRAELDQKKVLSKSIIAKEAVVVAVAPTKPAKEENIASIENSALIESLDRLTEQLISERHKNKYLENRLKENSDSLSKLLTDSLTEVKSEDKQYLSALQGLSKDKVDVNSNTDHKTITVNDKIVVLDNKVADSNVAIAKEVSKTNPRVDYNNSIDLTMKDQVDAIILMMQSSSQGSTKNRNKAKSTQTQQPAPNKKAVIRSVSLRQENNDSANKIVKIGGLQGKINQLISSKSATKSNYRQALTQEAEERKNSVRSIVVKKGETLWSISRRAYGDGKLYRKILKANPEITRGGVLRLSIGQKIRVPI